MTESSYQSPTQKLHEEDVRQGRRFKWLFALTTAASVCGYALLSPPREDKAAPSAPIKTAAVKTDTGSTAPARTVSHPINTANRSSALSADQGQYLYSGDAPPNAAELEALFAAGGEADEQNWIVLSRTETPLPADKDSLRDNKRIITKAKNGYALEEKQIGNLSVQIEVPKKKYHYGQ